MRKLRLWDVKQLTQCKINFSYLIFSFIFLSFHLFNNYLLVFSFFYAPDVLLNPSYIQKGKKQKRFQYGWSYLTSDGNRILVTPEMNSSLLSLSLLKWFCSSCITIQKVIGPVSVKDVLTWSPVDWYPTAPWWQCSSPTLDILSLHRWPAESPEHRLILVWHPIFRSVPSWIL